MASSAERQKRFRKSMEQKGFVQVAVWVPLRAAADFYASARMCLDNPDLTLGPMRNDATGQLVKRR